MCSDLKSLEFIHDRSPKIVAYGVSNLFLNGFFCCDCILNYGSFLLLFRLFDDLFWLSCLGLSFAFETELNVGWRYAILVVAGSVSQIASHFILGFRNGEALNEAGRPFHIADLHAEHFVHRLVELACSLQFAVGFQAFLLLESQFRSSRSAISYVRPINVPPRIHIALEDNLESIVGHFLLACSNGDGSLELCQSRNQSTYK